jgi:hypothetical protein
VPTDRKKEITFGVSFISDYDIQKIEIEFNSEQWRFAGNNNSQTSISFQYGIFDMSWYENDGWGALLHKGWPWIDIPELRVNSIVDIGNVPIELNGKDSKYRTIQKKDVNLNWASGRVLQIRWLAEKKTGASNYLAISSLHLKFYPSPHEMNFNIYKILFYSLLTIFTFGIVGLSIFFYRQKIIKSIFKTPEPEEVINIHQPILNSSNIPPAYLAFVGLKSGMLKKSDFLDEDELEEITKIPHSHSDIGHLFECEKCCKRIE